MTTQPDTSKTKEITGYIEKRADAVSKSPWFDCAREVQTESRGIVARYGIEHVGEFLSQVAKKAHTGVNTIRRYLALLDFVDRRILSSSHLPPDRALGFVRSNFSGLEKISRIDKLNPEAAQALLWRLYRGEITTRALENELEDERKKNPAAITARRGQAISSRMRELNNLERDLRAHIRSTFGAGTFGKLHDPSFVPSDWIYSDPNRDMLIGYLASAATSARGFEEVFVQAAFAGRFFSGFFLVMPFVKPEFVKALDDLNYKSRTRVGLLQYAGRKIDQLRDTDQPENRISIEMSYQRLDLDS